MYERFTDRARKVMQLANMEAQRLNHEYIGTEHLLLGLIKESNGVATTVLHNLGLNLDQCRAECLKLVQPGPDVVTMGRLPMTPRTKGCIEKAIQWARDLSHNHVGTEHLLLGLVSETEGVAAQVLLNFGVKLETVKSEVLNLLGITKETRKERLQTKVALAGHGALLKDLTKEWLKKWVGLPHQCNNPANCYTCECWEAFDAMFRHVG